MRREKAGTLERERRLVEILSRVGGLIADENDLEEVVQVAADEATPFVAAQFGGFVGREPNAADASDRLQALSAAVSAAFDSGSHSLSEIVGLTLAGIGAVRLDDVTTDSRVGRDLPDGSPAGDLPVRSYLGVPVLADGETAGALFFGHEEIGVFDEEAERVAVAFATLLGLAISRARLLESVREARATLDARSWAAVVLEHVGDGVVLVDPAGLVRLWNRAAERITRLGASDVLGRPIEEALPGWREVAPRVPLGGQGVPGRPLPLPLGIGDGELWLSLHGVESEEGIVYTFHDVSGERELEERRADLIATVSHEIRTPVAAVYGAARTLLRSELEGDVRERLLRIVLSESERLTGLVGEILLAGAIDAGRLAVARDEFDLSGLVREAVESSAAAAGDGRLELELPAAEASVVADADRVGQVLTNLLDNAFKYGGGGDEEAFTVRVLPRDTTVRVEVSDHGAGVPELEQERIFEKFHRLEPHLEGGVRGSGLGLYISRELVVRMQGTMGVESVDGEGATFWFELPRAAALPRSS